ncbi:integrase, catalytic region, zinc finger, CCHC-type containing protein [Tanacetum coccineum]
MYALVSQHRVAKDLWGEIKLLMQGTSLTKQERECKLYDEFDKFTYKKGESLHEYYLRFTLLLNDMNIYKMPLEQFQVNTKFLNTLPDEWSKFVTDVKLVKDLHTTNVDQLHAHLEQHERHANEVRLMHERNSDPLALVASHQITQSPYQTHQHTYQNTQLQPPASTYPSPQYGSPYQSQQYSTHQSSTPLSVTYPSNDFQSSIHHNIYSPSSSIPQLEYPPQINQQSEFSQQDSGLIVPVFQKGDDPIDAINHMMSFLTLLLSPPGENKNFFCWVTSDLPLQSSGAILENRGGYLLQLHKGKVTCPTVHQNQREKEMIPWFKEKVDVLASHGQFIHYGSDALAEVHNHDNMNNDLKAQQSKPKLYVGDIIVQTNPIVIPDSEETLALAEESRSKMLLKHKDNMMLEKKKQVDTTPIDYAALNQLYKDFPTRFVPQTELSAEQAFWSQNSVNSSEHQHFLIRTLPMLRTTPTAITEGSWGFEHTKACFRDEIIPFVKALKDLFSTFNQHLVDELFEVQNVFYQMEQAVEQHRNFSKGKLCLIKVFKFDKLFELNEIVSQVPEKDTVIKKLKERIKSLSGKMDKDKIKEDFERLKTYYIELDHRVTKLIAENEHLKQTYKQLYDSIKPARIRSKEQCDDLINQVNIKSAEIFDLNASLQEKALAITALKDELRKLKGKALVDNNVSNHPSDPELHQVNVEPITPKLLNKMTAHSAYIKHSQEEAAVLRDLVDHIKANYPLDPLLESACKYTKLIQEMLSKISKTCPSINSSGEQLVAVTPMNKVKRVRFTEPVTSLRNTKIAHTSNLASNKPMLSSTGVKQSTSASGSQPSGNTKKDKIQQTPSSTLKNKVEAHPRKVKSSLKNKDCVVAPKGTAHVQHSKLNANYELKCVKCNGCMLSDNHDLCVLDFINNVNARAKSRSVKKNSKRKVWKPTGKVFTNIGYIWRPTGRTFTIVGNACPLTRITTTTEVSLRKSSALDNKTPKPVVTLVYSKKPRKSKTSIPVNNYKVVQIVLWYLDSDCSKHMTGDCSQLTNFVNKFLGTIKLVAFRHHTCYIYNLEGVDLLTGSRGDNLYTLSLGDMMASSHICLLSKASKTKSWLWHRRLSHLNFGAINHLARHSHVRGLPKIKYEKDHLCSACALGKSTKKPYKPKYEDTNQEKIYMLHMDLCGPIRVMSVNGKKYILVIVDDYSRFTWVKCLRSKDEAPAFIINFLKMIQVQLKETVRRIRTDNGTEFVNQTLREYYEKVGISHETSVARSLQQNGVVERRNRTLIEAARTMLIYAKAPLFL